MTKQAKIREGLAKRLQIQEKALLQELDNSSPFARLWEDLAETFKEYYRALADEVLSALASEGAVLKVERELPERTALIYVDSGQPLRAEDAYKLAQRDWLRAGGGFFEPLI